MWGKKGDGERGFYLHENTYYRLFLCLRTSKASCISLSKAGPDTPRDPQTPHKGPRDPPKCVAEAPGSHIVALILF